MNKEKISIIKNDKYGIRFIDVNFVGELFDSFKIGWSKFEIESITNSLLFKNWFKY